MLVAFFATVQPLLGFMQHSFFRKNKCRGLPGHAHLWLGRILFVIAVVNGGLGIRLANEDGDDDDDGEQSNSTWMHVYTGVANAMGALYITTVLITALLKRRRSGR